MRTAAGNGVNLLWVKIFWAAARLSAIFCFMDPHSTAQAVTSAAQAVTDAAHAMSNAAQSGTSFWSWPNLLLAAQDIILVITAAFILWYTRETRKLREFSRDQLNLLRIQTEIAREQADRDRVASQREAVLAENESNPNFQWPGSIRSDPLWSGEFVNSGATINDVSVTTDAPLDHTIAPRGTIPHGQRGAVQMQARRGGRLPASWVFKVHYRSNINVEGVLTFRVNEAGGVSEVSGSV